MPDLQCTTRHDTSAGLLNSTQCVEWTGPPLPERLHPDLAARMDQEHVAAVGSSVWKLLRCRVQGDEVVCSGFGVLPMLTFGQPVTAMESHSVCRTWTVTGGWLARRGEVFGSIRFAWTESETGDGLWRHRLSATVEGYPSRFLHASATATATGVLRRVGDLYAGYHARVTCGFLRRLARWVRAAAEGQEG